MSSSLGERPVDVAGLFDLHGRVAVVTGASSGLGARFVHVLRGAGAEVVASARRVDRLQSLAEGVGDGILAVGADVGVEADRERLVGAALEHFGRIDILVNNAGTSVVSPVEDEPLDDFRNVLRVNLEGLFHLCQLAGRDMLGRGQGSIVNVASMLGLVASAPVKQASYVASKGAVISLTRELAVQWARRGVRVNALAPGWFPSELTMEMFRDEQSMAWLGRNCPMARGGDAHELDGALLFLCATASSYVTGQVLTVDGGWTAR